MSNEVLQELFSFLVSKSEGSSGGKCESPAIGLKVFIRTVSYHYLGRITRVFDDAFVLTSASWIADSGRFGEFLRTGQPSEVEAYMPETEVRVMRQSIVDWHDWKHDLPTESK